VGGRLIDFLMTLLGSVLSRLLADELKSWTPRIVNYLIQRATRNLPQDQRKRFDEEWRSHINETPGELGKLLVALDFLRASRVMSSDLAHKGSSWHRRRRHLGSAVAVGVLALVAVHETKIECGAVLLATGGNLLLASGGNFLAAGERCQFRVSDHFQIPLPDWVQAIVIR
jgi:hypothetical protein